MLMLVCVYFKIFNWKFTYTSCLYKINGLLTEKLVYQVNISYILLEELRNSSRGNSSSKIFIENG